MAKSEHKDSVTANATKPTSLADAIRDAIDTLETLDRILISMGAPPAKMPRLEALRAALPRAEAADALAEALEEIAQTFLTSETGNTSQTVPGSTRDALVHVARAAMRRYRESP